MQCVNVTPCRALTAQTLQDLSSCPGAAAVFCCLVGSGDATSVLFLQESQRQREMVEQRHAKYKEIIWDLQHQLDESKRRIQEYRVTHTHTHTHYPPTTTHTFSISVTNCAALFKPAGWMKTSEPFWSLARPHWCQRAPHLFSQSGNSSQIDRGGQVQALKQNLSFTSLC